MKKVYHLSTCDTCKKILKELELPQDYELQDLRTAPLIEEDREATHRLTGSDEELFNKRARLYKERDLKNESLNEIDYKKLILEHYTFLKRPVILCHDQIFIGNSKKTVAAAKNCIHG